MKNLLPAFMLIFLYVGCYTPYSNSIYPEYINIVYEKPEYTNLPMKPNNNEIEVIFPGEKILKPYIKVDIIESSGDAFSSTKALIKDLKIKGMFRGVDAIVLMSNNTFSHDDGEYVTSVKTASGLGIKYIENIDYLDDCIKQVKVVAYNKRTKKYENSAEIKTNWKGFFIELTDGNPFFWDFLYNFSDQHLIQEMTNWSFNRRVGTDHKIYKTRVLTGKTDFAKKVFIKSIKERVESLEVTDNVNKKYSAKIKYHYDDDGILVAKEIDSKVLGKFRMEFTYGKKDYPLRYDVYKLLKGKKEFYFKAIFEMYEQEDLDLLLVNENVIGR